MNRLQVDKNKTRQVRIDAGVHRLLKIKAAETGESLRGLIEDAVSDLLQVKVEDFREDDFELTR